MFNNIISLKPSEHGRRRSGIAAAFLLGAAVAGCAGPPALNSERIAARFGSYEIEVLRADGNVRVSGLASRHDGRPVTRTLAVVSFPAAVDPRVAGEHARIVAGGSIGAVFRETGWRISKPLLAIGEFRASQPGIGQLMDLELPVTLALHAYRFEVGRDGVTIPYATIVELHHPDYLARADVARIYGSGPALPSAPAAADLEQRVAAILDTLSTRLAP